MACQICNVNTYCVGDHLMTACKSSSSTLGALGKTEEAACICVNGYYDDEGFCVLCPEDTYCWLENKYECPDNFSSILGQHLLSLRCIV